MNNPSIEQKIAAIKVVCFLDNTQITAAIFSFEVDFRHDGGIVEFDLKENELLHLNTIRMKKITTENSAEEYQPKDVRNNKYYLWMSLLRDLKT